MVVERPLAGRPAIVTGGGSGVGRGIALALAAAGADVAILGRTRETLEETCGDIEKLGVRGLPVICDVRLLDDIQAAVKTVVAEFGGVRILVNNAQISTRGRLLEISEETIENGWLSGPMAAHRISRECHPHLRKAGGAIVNVSSGAALLAPPGMGAYAAVKSAMHAFSRAAAVEWAADGIRVNAILPLASSPGYERWRQSHPAGYERSLDHVPLRALADSQEDVGGAVVFLVSDAAKMITGTILPIDGGVSHLR